MNWYDAQNWLDLVDHAWYGLVLIAVAAVPAHFARKNHEAIQTVNRKTDTIVGNVQNGHTEPLRADLDRAIQAVDDLAHDVRGIRTDLAMEEDRRLRDVAELENRIGRHHRED